MASGFSAGRILIIWVRVFIPLFEFLNAWLRIEKFCVRRLNDRLAFKTSGLSFKKAASSLKRLSGVFRLGHAFKAPVCRFNGQTAA